MRGRRLLDVVFFAVALPVSLCVAEEIGPKIGQPVPNLIGRTLDDQSYRLKSDTGSPKVINFFSVSCKPCRQEIPELAKLEKQYPGVKFISVHAQEEKPEVVEKFVKSLPGVPANIVLTSGGLQANFHYLGLPHTMVLDNNNVVLMNLVGYTSANMRALNNALQRLPKP
jgi:thiol-disulfide isomerase/thioredoxin